MRSNTSVITRGALMQATGASSGTSVLAKAGPKVLAGGDHGQVSTCVTRSIGDWDGSRAMIPQPELLRFEVQPSEHVRCVMCSDGVWDFLTLDEAASCARRSAPSGLRMGLPACCHGCCCSFLS